MRLVIATLILLLLAASVGAEPPNGLPMITVTSASTNASPIAADHATNSVPVSGWFDTVYFDITTSYGSPTVTVVVATAPSRGGLPERTLLTKAITADAQYAVRSVIVDSAASTLVGAGARQPLQSAYLVLKAYAYNTTNNTCQVDAYFVVAAEPGG